MEVNCTNTTFNSSLEKCSLSFKEYNYGRQDYDASFAVEHLLSTILVPILSVIVVVVGLTGNLLVVIVVTCNQQMRSTTNIMIINLAMADLVFIVICVPYKALDYALPKWPFGDAWCKIVWYIIVACAYSSIYTLVLMSIDRFLAVVYPVSSMLIRTPRNACKAIAATWIIILVACVPCLQSHGIVFHVTDKAQYSECVFIKKTYSYVTFKIFFCVTSYIIPLLFIFCLYAMILKKLWSKETVPGKQVTEENQKSKRRCTRMVIVIIMVFAFCWCPIQVVLLLKSLGVYTIGPTTITIEIVAYIFAYSNSCINPFLYAFLSENFRKGFKKIISCSTRFNVLRSFDS